MLTNQDVNTCMNRVGIFWIAFSILFFSCGYLWQNKEDIIGKILKSRIESAVTDKIKDVIPDDLNNIIDKIY